MGLDFYKKVFTLGTMKLTKDHPLFLKFIALCCRLSPENLTCDGECGRAEINKRHKQIMLEWRDLEFQFGSLVTEKEVWDAELAPTPTEHTMAALAAADRDPFDNQTDAEADSDVLRSAGFGTDEDYGGDCERL